MRKRIYCRFSFLIMTMFIGLFLSSLAFAQSFVDQILFQNQKNRIFVSGQYRFRRFFNAASEVSLPIVDPELGQISFPKVSRNLGGKTAGAALINSIVSAYELLITHLQDQELESFDFDPHPLIPTWREFIIKDAGLSEDELDAFSSELHDRMFSLKARSNRSEIIVQLDRAVNTGPCNKDLGRYACVEDVPYKRFISRGPTFADAIRGILLKMNSEVKREHRLVSFLNSSSLQDKEASASWALYAIGQYCERRSQLGLNKTVDLNRLVLELALKSVKQEPNQRVLNCKEFVQNYARYREKSTLDGSDRYFKVKKDFLTLAQDSIEFLFFDFDAD